MSPERFYIVGFSPNSCNKHIQFALDVFNEYATVANKPFCCRAALEIRFQLAFYSLSTHWENREVDDIYREIRRFSTLIAANPAALSEYDDLVSLMMAHANPDTLEEAQHWAHQIAAGCTGKDHLYHDMGFAERAEISRIMRECFPTLAALNEGAKMKWKKFLYKKICETQGVPVCPTPSCQECADYKKCFYD